jgi:hypothetical protein
MSISGDADAERLGWRRVRGLPGFDTTPGQQLYRRQHVEGGMQGVEVRRHDESEQAYGAAQDQVPKLVCTMRLAGNMDLDCQVVGIAVSVVPRSHRSRLAADGAKLTTGAACGGNDAILFSAKAEHRSRKSLQLSSNVDAHCRADSSRYDDSRDL